MERSAIRDFIATSNWFDDAPERVLHTLVDAAKLKSYHANSYLWSMGETNTEVYGVVTGRLRMYVASPMGQEFVLVDREEGSWLGEACLKDDLGRAIGARTMIPSEILVIHRQVLLDVALDWPQMYRNLFLHQVITARGLYELLGGMLFYPLHARVAARLMALVHEHGEQVEEGVLINIKVSQNDFAHLAMGSRQRVNRIFRDWDKRGLVETRGHLLLIPDIDAFERELAPFE
jgi:CRP/FNR family transcriptional regulator, cyclic AMP receptor protein